MAGEIFISYRRADQACARLLHAQLKAEGVEAWYDAQVGAGEDWRVATAKALEASRIFVLLFSSNAALSDDIAKELAAATLEKKLIIPVRLENIAPKGAFLYELASRNWINAFEDTEAKLAELAKALAHMVRTGARDESLLPFERAEKDKKLAARKRTIIAAMAAALVLATAAAVWLLWPARRWTVESSRPFISTLALEGEPAFSSDGKMLAYTSGTAPQSRKIYIRDVAGGDGIKVSSDEYDDVSPTWSPDATRIAYVAQKPGEPCRIMVASVPAGETREVGRCTHSQSTSVSWQPGTSFLYYYDLVDVTGDSIFRLDLETGARLRLIKKPSFQEMVHLQCAPDGKSLLYLWRLTASTSAMVIRDSASGEERTLGTIVGTGSAAWSEDAHAVFAATASGIGSEITAYPLSRGAPYHVYAAAINVSHLAAGAGGLLALETDDSRQNLARATSTPAAQPDLIESVNGRTWAPTFAPDGTLAFLSNRSGTNAVWTMKPGAAPTLLFDAGLVDLFRLEYSPDGTRLAAAIGKADGVTIKILTADGGTITSFDSPTLGFGHPNWTPDSKEVILLDRIRHHELGIAVDNPARRRPIGLSPPWGPEAVRDNGTFSARIDKPGLWQIDKGVRLISDKYPSRFDPPITFRGDDLLVPDFNAEGGARILAQPLAGGPDRVLAYAPGAEVKLNGLQSKMAVNPKTGEVIYVASVQGDTNIDLLTLARH
jgi:hypothetical protein